MSTTTRTFSKDTNVRLDDISHPDRPNFFRLVLSDPSNNLVIEGELGSILMLVDRINDRVSAHRRIAR